MADHHNQLRMIKRNITEKAKRHMPYTSLWIMPWPGKARLAYPQDSDIPPRVPKVTAVYGSWSDCGTPRIHRV